MYYFTHDSSSLFSTCRWGKYQNLNLPEKQDPIWKDQTNFTKTQQNHINCKMFDSIYYSISLNLTNDKSIETVKNSPF